MSEQKTKSERKRERENCWKKTNHHDQTWEEEKQEEEHKKLKEEFIFIIIKLKNIYFIYREEENK